MIEITAADFGLSEYEYEYEYEYVYVYSLDGYTTFWTDVGYICTYDQYAGFEIAVQDITYQWSPINITTSTGNTTNGNNS